jgi:hypothetical protein
MTTITTKFDTFINELNVEQRNMKIAKYLAEEIFPSVVSVELFADLVRDGYTEVVINTDGAFYALRPSHHVKSKEGHWSRVTRVGNSHVVSTDFQYHSGSTPLDARLDVWWIQIPQVVFMAVFDLTSRRLRLRQVHGGDDLVDPVRVKMRVENTTHYFSTPPMQEANMGQYVKALFGPLYKSDVRRSCLEDHDLQYVIIDSCGEFIAMRAESFVVSTEGPYGKFKLSSDPVLRERILRLNMYEWADDTNEVRSNCMLNLVTGEVVVLLNNGTRSLTYALEKKEDEPAVEVSEEDDAPNTEEVNPKDVIGSSKIPMTLWPATATAYGALGLFNGALKYGKANFRATPVKTSIYVDAAMRHLASYMEGEEVDPDDGVPHLAAALASIAIIVDAETSGTLVDDRQIESSGFRETMNHITDHVKRLQELHADKAPKHHTRNNA